MVTFDFEDSGSDLGRTLRQLVRTYGVVLPSESNRRSPDIVVTLSTRSAITNSYAIRGMTPRRPGSMMSRCGEPPGNG